MSDGISLREFGRRIDVSGEAVRKAVNSGRIPPEAMGEKVLRGGRKRPVIVNVDMAMKAWGANTDATQQRDKATMAAAGKRTQARLRGEEPNYEDESEGGGDGPVTPASRRGEGPTINESKRVEAAYKARMAKLEYEKAVGKLVDAEKIKVLFAQQIVDARTKIMAVGRKAQGQIPHLTVDDIETIEDLCAEALEELTVGSD